MDKDKWAKSTDRTYLFAFQTAKKREGEGPFGGKTAPPLACSPQPEKTFALTGMDGPRR